MVARYQAVACALPADGSHEQAGAGRERGDRSKRKSGAGAGEL